MSEKFEYKYSAPTMKEREEIDSIRKQYLPKDKSMTKIERLRYLDNKVKSIPVIVSLCLGVVGLLFFGLGMTFFLEWVNLWFLGIPCGLIGISLMIPAYPMYCKLLKKYKEMYGEEIIKLSNELLNERND